jgi:hypothetical protein
MIDKSEALNKRESPGGEKNGLKNHFKTE